MNFRTTYFLFAFLFGMLGIVLLAQLFGKRTTIDAEYVLPSMHDASRPVKNEDIDTVELEYQRPEGAKLVLYKTEQGWRSKTPSVRLDTHAVDDIVRHVMDAKQEPNADVTSNLEQFGLRPPALVVTLIKKGGDDKWKLNVGNESIGGDDAVVYVSSSDRPKEVFAVGRRGLSSLLKTKEQKKSDSDSFKGLAELRTKHLLVESALNVRELKLQDFQRGGEALVLEKEGTGDKWKITKPPYGEADETQVRDLVSNIEKIRVEGDADFVADDATDFSKYGLTDKPKRLRIEAKQRPGGLLGGDEKKEPITNALLIGDKADDKGEKLYARLESENSVVKIPAKVIEPIVKEIENPNGLRNKDLVELDKTKTDAIDIQNASGSIKLRKTGEPAAWKIYEGATGVNAEDSVVQALLDSLLAKGLIREFPAASVSDAELGLDKPMAELSIWLDGLAKEEKKDEKKDEKKEDKKGAEKKDEKKEEPKPAPAEPKLKEAKPTIKLAFGKKKGDIVYVRRESGGDVTRAAVPESVLTRITQDRLAFLEHKLPSFPFTAEPVKLVLTRGSETLELEREKKDDKSPVTWKFKLPKELASRSADALKVENAIRELRDLHTDRFILEKPAATDLDRFGLKSPDVKAVVTVRKDDKNTEEHAYLFGKPTDDKATVYAKQGERDVVFTVRQDALNSLRSELLDPKVLSFDPAKIKSIKFQGWQKVVGGVLTLEFERKTDGKEWVVKKGLENFQLDPAKLDSFINSVNNLTAERFVVYKTGPKPEHELGDKERALLIEIDIGEKEPIKLALGKIDPDKKGYFATISTLPGDVFVVPLARFEKLLEGAKFFSK